MCNDNDHLESQVEVLRSITLDRLPIELRCVSKKGRGCKTGLFDDLRKLVHSATDLNKAGYNCYFSLNKIKVDDSRIINAVGSIAICGDDICGVSTVLVDIDPVREIKGPSSELEKLAADFVRKSVEEFLISSCGFPAPTVIDSGNGYHLLFHVNLSRNDCSLVKQFLSKLASLFDTPEAKVDVSVSDLVRVTRLPGTQNFKGDETNDRPYRMSQVLKLGDSGILCEADLKRVLEKNALSQDERKEQGRRWLRHQKIDLESSNDKSLCRFAAKLIIDFGVQVDFAVQLLLEFCDERGYPDVVEKIVQICAWADGRRKTSEAQNPAGKTPANEGKDRRSYWQADLMAFVQLHHRLFITPESEVFASVPLECGGWATYAIDSNEYLTLLSLKGFELSGNVCNPTAIGSVQKLITGKARLHGTPMDPKLRIGGDGNCFFVDLGTEDWGIVEIDRAGWRLVKEAKVLFRRSSGIRPLPNPDMERANIGGLHNFLNLSSFQDFQLLCGFILVCFHPSCEYPILYIFGEQGSSKSTVTTCIRRLTDPSLAPLRSSPRNDDDFAIAGYNNHVVVFDNISYIDDRQSDNLCRMATGAAFAKRTQYSNRNEMLVSFRNPVILNGIGEIVKRSDLMDRCILIELPRLKERKASGEFWDEFAGKAPSILGGFFNAIHHALANPIVSSDIDPLPRMAEFCRFVVSAEPELARQWNMYVECNGLDLPRWELGDFHHAYLHNIEAASNSAAEHIPFLHHLQKLLHLAPNNAIVTSPTELLKLLQNEAMDSDERCFHGTGWPQSASQLGAMLSRGAPVLRRYGIEIEKTRKPGGDRERQWKLTLSNPRL